MGIGPKLVRAALEKARKQGYSRIELTVRMDNKNAKALYKRFGFTLEGVNRNAFLIDGQFYDTY